MPADGPICDPSKGIAYSTGVGEYTSGDATPVANLAPAKATCPAGGFQVRPAAKTAQHTAT